MKNSPYLDKPLRSEREVKRLWIIVYHHRHGCDAWPTYGATEPDLDLVAKDLDNWEPEREEWLELFGPFSKGP